MERSRTDARKVQQVGYSTYVVSLPKDWVNEVKLKKGDLVTYQREDDGSIRLFPGLSRGQERVANSVIKADLCQDQGLLSRVLTGCYIVGHDNIRILSQDELRPEHLEEIRSTVKRLTGLGIVEQKRGELTVQTFVDPTKFSAPGLIRRLHVITLSMQEAVIRALLDRDEALAKEALHMEHEADRIYWLIVRQLLLAASDKKLSKKVGIASPFHLIDNRLVAKNLEEVADNLEGIAREVLRLNGLKYKPNAAILEEVSRFSDLVEGMSSSTMKAFFDLDVGIANDVIETMNIVQGRHRQLTDDILTRKGDTRVLCAFRKIIWGLEQIARYCDMIAEITINRFLEEPSEICNFKKE